MLYTNEEPLVQKTCIKTANLQHDNCQSETLETQALLSHSLLSKANESRESIRIEITDPRLWSSSFIVLVGQEPRVHLSKAEYEDSDGRVSTVVR